MRVEDEQNNKAEQNRFYEDFQWQCACIIYKFAQLLISTHNPLGNIVR